MSGMVITPLMGPLDLLHLVYSYARDGSDKNVEGTNETRRVPRSHRQKSRRCWQSSKSSHHSTYLTSERQKAARPAAACFRISQYL